MAHCWDLNIQGRWRSSAAVAWLLMASTAASYGQSGESLGRAYRKNPTPSTHAALLRYAESHAQEPAGALAFLALGIGEADQKQGADALKHLNLASGRLPQVRDFTGYYQAVVRTDHEEFAEAETALEGVWRQPGSPLVSKAAPLAVQAGIATQHVPQARELVRKWAGQLGELQTNVLTGRAAEAVGDRAGAAAAFQRVYYQYPLSKEAKEASEALSRLNPPVPTSEMVLARTSALMKNGQARTAREELEQAVPNWTGPSRDLGQLRIGAARYYANENEDALTYLTQLSVRDPEVDAERLYFRHALARRLNRDAEADAILQQLKEKYPKSSWRLKALVAAGDRFLVRNQADRYTPYYQACYQEYPDDSQASYCHWRVAWNAYITRQPLAARWLRSHLELYPDSEKNAAALYFLGRLAQNRHEYGEARTFFQTVQQRFPNSYFAVTAGQQLTRDNAVRSAVLGASAARFLETIRWPAPPKPFRFVVTGNAAAPLERARLLTSAGLDDLAELELRAAAEREPPHRVAFAMELAKSAEQQNAPERAIRYIKRFVPGYLNLSLSDSPNALWKYAFPLPYRGELESAARANGLDPFTVAALVRQESEFDVKIISRAKAYGLTQVLPSTARDLSRSLGLGPFRESMLFDPGINLRLGTAFLKQLLARWGNRWEETLAAYNAGPTRARNWVTWADYQEPAEFAENIPFAETRGYVQIVLRNADLYRRLYGAGKASVPSTDGANDPPSSTRALPQ